MSAVEEGGEATLAEQHEDARRDLFKRASQHPLAQQTLEIFPDAAIADIRPIQPGEALPDAPRGTGRRPMKNLADMMKQAQEMQQKMTEMQEALAAHEVVGKAAAGMVEVRMNAKGELLGLRIDPSLIDPAEAEVMEDLITAGFNDARVKAEAHAREEMRRVSGGLELPARLQAALLTCLPATWRR